jgi:hypothetical protein
MKPIRDLRKLKPICKKYGLIYHPQHKYIVGIENLSLLNGDDLLLKRKMQKDNLTLKYFSGCFYPYACKVAQ